MCFPIFAFFYLCCWTLQLGAMDACPCTRAILLCCMVCSLRRFRTLTGSFMFTKGAESLTFHACNSQPAAAQSAGHTVNDLEGGMGKCSLWSSSCESVC